MVRSSLLHCGFVWEKNVDNFKWLLLWSLWASVAQISFWSLPGAGKWKIAKMVVVHWPRWPPYLYIVKTFKNLLLQNQGCLVAEPLHKSLLLGPIHLYGKMLIISNDLHWSLQGQCSSNFMWSLLGAGERKIAKMGVVHWSKWLLCPYMVKTFNFFFSEPNMPWALIFAQIMGDRRSTKIAKKMVLCWRVSFLRQGQICFPMHLYGPYTFILEVLRWLVDQQQLKLFWLEI